MTDSDLRAAPPATHRLWLVLVLLVGILGMHGLASDHAGMTGGTPAGASAVQGHALMAGMVEMAGPAGMVGMTGAAARPDREAARVLLSGAQVPEHGATSMAGLCLAVLAGALLLALAARQQGRAGQDQDLLPARLLARLRALPPPRPPDLVAGLCVSRT